MTAEALISSDGKGGCDVHQGSPVLMLLLAGELGLLIFVVAAGALWWAVPRVRRWFRCRSRMRPPQSAASSIRPERES